MNNLRYAWYICCKHWVIILGQSCLFVPYDLFCPGIAYILYDNRALPYVFASEKNTENAPTFLADIFDK